MNKKQEKVDVLQAVPWFQELSDEHFDKMCEITRLINVDKDTTIFSEGEKDENLYIVLEGRVWHTSGVNTTENERRALLFALYNRDFLRPQVNWEVLLSDETKARLTEEDKALLGMGSLCNVHGVDIIMREGYDLDSAVVM